MSQIRIIKLIEDPNIPPYVARDLIGLELHEQSPRKFLCLGCDHEEILTEKFPDAYLFSFLDIMNLLRAKREKSAMWLVKNASRLTRDQGNNVILIGKIFCEEM